MTTQTIPAEIISEIGNQAGLAEAHVRALRPLAIELQVGAEMFGAKIAVDDARVVQIAAEVRKLKAAADRLLGLIEIPERHVRDDRERAQAAELLVRIGPRPSVEGA